MKKLIEQIMKFGVVGVFCFLIDFAITMFVSALLRNLAGASTDTAALLGAFVGFTISVIINYLLSMKFVFVRKEDMDRRREFVVFTVLSLIGLGIHEALIAGCMYVAGVLSQSATLPPKLFAPSVLTAGSKIFATGVVMVYNFITRKIFLERKDG